MNNIKIHYSKKLIIQNFIHKNYFKSLGNNIRFGGTGQFYCSENISIGANVYLGRNFYMDAECDIRIGSGTMIGPKVTIISGTHNYNSLDLRAIPYDQRIIDTPVIIGDNVWIGANVTICPGAIIEEGAIVGMGAVIAGRVPEFSVVVSSKQIILKRRNVDVYQKLKKHGKIYNERMAGKKFEAVQKEELEI